jgi:hypothetical protein
MEHLRCAGHIVDMVAQGYEEVEEQLTASSLHLQLHSTTSLECVPASDYQR